MRPAHEVACQAAAPIPQVILQGMDTPIWKLARVSDLESRTYAYSMLRLQAVAISGGKILPPDSYSGADKEPGDLVPSYVFIV